MDRAARLPDLVFELDSIDEEHNGVIVGAAPPWPPVVRIRSIRKTGGHGGPPLQLWLSFCVVFLWIGKRRALRNDPETQAGLRRFGSKHDD